MKLQDDKVGYIHIIPTRRQEPLYERPTVKY